MIAPVTTTFANELRFYTANLASWAKGVQCQLEARVPLASDNYHLADETMCPRDKFKRACVKAAIIGRNLRYSDTLTVQDTDWVEVLDPQHRYGFLMHQHALVWKSSHTGYSFQRWMRQKASRAFTQDEVKVLHTIWSSGIDKSLKSFEAWQADIEQIPCVRYLARNEASGFRVEVDSRGRIIQNGQVVLLKEGEKFIIILTEKNEFYGGIYKRGHFHHSSFFAGAALRVAAEISIFGGFITEVIEKTGHYFDSAPTGGDFRTILMLQQLHKIGANLQDVSVFLNVHPTATFTPYRMSAKCYLELNLVAKPWYVGKISFEAACKLLADSKKKFLIRQCEYPIALTERKLVKSLLPLNAAFAPFERLDATDDGCIIRTKIYDSYSLLEM